ncbi:MAG: hypothetical protein LW834_13265 [Cyanobium sp. 49614_E6]|nr:hypothetical protein [Cyanobium sp. 49614_E6]
MANYLHDWQPQRLSGIPGTQFYDDGHAGANGHNHFGFLKPEMAREAVDYLRSHNVQVTEWSGDQGGKVGGHKDPGHYDGRSFDVPASQWSPTPDSAKEIAGMRRVEELMDRFLEGKGVPREALPFLKQQSGGSGTLASAGGDTVTTEMVERQQVDDWKASASAADRNTDPSSAGYWQRQDMKIWAQANPKLAAAAMAKAGVDPSALQAPSTSTVTETRDVPAPAPAAPAAPKPEDRGALAGTRVGGTPPKGLQPYVFEIHADAAASKGGKTGFIGSYLDRDNPLFQSLNAVYGNYGPNNSRQWRGGDLGAPRHGVSIIETRTAGPGMGDVKAQEAEANRLYSTLMADADVKSGKRPLVFFAGHADTTNAGQQGAADGDAPEKTWNTGVMSALRRRAQQEGRTNFQFVDSIVDNDDKGSNTNWARAKALREQWIQQQGGGQ